MIIVLFGFRFFLLYKVSYYLLVFAFFVFS